MNALNLQKKEDVIPEKCEITGDGTDNFY